MKPGIDTYAKTAVSMTLSQMVLHQPELREEIVAIYYEVFTRFVEATLDDDIIDSEFLGLAISDTIDCGLRELLPIIKELYDKHYVSIGINGDYNEVVKLFDKQPSYSPMKEIFTIYEIYDDIVKNWWGYNMEKDQVNFLVE